MTEARGKLLKAIFPENNNDALEPFSFVFTQMEDISYSYVVT